MNSRLVNFRHLLNLFNLLVCLSRPVGVGYEAGEILIHTITLLPASFSIIHHWEGFQVFKAAEFRSRELRMVRVLAKIQNSSFGIFFRQVHCHTVLTVCQEIIFSMHWKLWPATG
jgi:hypothetical protein